MNVSENLEYDNVINIYNIDISTLPDGMAFAVMQYIDGGSLESRLEKGPLPADEAVTLLIKVADALAYADKNGLEAHRDLKPANILLDREGKPYVADFGLAICTAEEQFRRSERAGTPHYMAPERIRNGRYSREEPLDVCDIWALGVILYEMLTGHRPFEDADGNKLFDKIERDAPRLRSLREAGGVDAELETICLKCLEKEPIHRYPAASELRDELRQWHERRQGLPLVTQEIHTFRDLIAWHSRFIFIGRKAIFRRVDEFLSRHNHGLVVVAGPPGKGKSALMTYLAKSLEGESTLPPISFYYRSGSDEPEQFIGHLSASLLINHGLVTPSNARLPLDPHTWFGRLQCLLREVGKGLSAEKRQFILVDALDEARSPEGQRTAFQCLSLELPPHVYIIATTRDHPGIQPLLRRADGHIIIDMEDPDGKNDDRLDGRAYAQRVLADLNPSESLLDEIARVGDGNFLVLEHLCARVKALGCGSEGMQELLSNLSLETNAPDRLGWLYEEFWQRLKQGKEKVERTRIGLVLQMLAFAQAPLTRGMLMRIPGFSADAFDDWESTWHVIQEYLHVVGDRSEDGCAERMRLYHASFESIARKPGGISEHFAIIGRNSW